MKEKGVVVVTTFYPANINRLSKNTKFPATIIHKNKAEVVMGISVGDHVIFKREVINKQFLIELGTSGAFLSYKVVGIEDNEVTLQPDFGYPFNVPINDVEHRPKDFDPDKMVAELADRIDEFEHRKP